MAEPLGSSTHAGRSAKYFYVTGEILRVRISPDGEWVVATAVNGSRVGIMAQRFGSRRIQVVEVSTTFVRLINWIGRDTLLVEFGGGRGRNYLRIEFSKAEGGDFTFSKSRFMANGRLVSGLPAEEGFVLWEVERKGRNSVHRVTLDELSEFRWFARRSSQLGEIVASIKGSSRRWIVDANGRVVAAYRRDEGGHSILYRSDGEEDFKEIVSFSDGSKDFRRPQGLTRDGNKLIVTAYGGYETIGLFEFDPITRKIGKEIYRRDDVDIGFVWFDPMTQDILSVSFEVGSRNRTEFLEAPRAEFGPKFGEQDPPIESVRVVGSTLDRKRFIYWTSGPTEPGAHYLRNPAKDETSLLGQKSAKIDRGSLVPIESFDVISADGTHIEALLTLPSVSSVDGHPLIVMPHGGPVGVHDSQVFDPLIQYFASWGFAVLQVNYRGSSGYGTKFEEAAKKQWAKGIEDDIAAAVEQTMERPEIDESRVCIIGGSYGGFSAITSALRDPNRYRCVSTINGVSDIPLLYESSDMADNVRVMKFYSEYVGDLETERDKLLAISPVYHLEDVSSPILVIYGDKDRRVDPDNAHRLIAMLKLYGKSYEEILVKGGAHSFTDEQWVKVLPQLRKFLTKHLMPGENFVPDSE